MATTTMYLGGLCCRSIYLDPEAKLRAEKRTPKIAKSENLFKI
jgi:hypothetical protein